MTNITTLFTMGRHHLLIDEIVVVTEGDHCRAEGYGTFNKHVGYTAWTKEDILKIASQANWTGLVDKNNVKICKGNIVKVDVQEVFQTHHGRYGLKEVAYLSGMWVLLYFASEKGRVLPKHYMSCQINDMRKNFDKENLFYDNNNNKIEELEIIGDVSQEKELLEKYCNGKK